MLISFNEILLPSPHCSLCTFYLACSWDHLLSESIFLSEDATCCEKIDWINSEYSGAVGDY